jgi:hypothetical protein
MILCPNCHHQEVAGALYCSECGAQLITTSNLTTQSLEQSITGSLKEVPLPKSKHTPAAPTSGVDSVVSLHFLDSGQVLQLAGRKEFSLGRITEGQPIFPDVDLSPYQAFALGVSRLHASIKVYEDGLYIVDLGSSNGTRVNGQKITPQIAYPLKHGDVIALGKLKIQILIRR